MTRFARAKGSKSSNERAPEDSTPWEVMKEQLLQAKTDNEEAKKRKEAEQQRIENYENFLKEHKVQKRKATWCDFPEAENKKPKDSHQQLPKKLKKNKQKVTNGTQPTNENISNVEVGTPHEKKDLKKKKKKKQKSEQTSPNQEQIAPEQSEQNASEKNILKKKSKKKNAAQTTLIDSNTNEQQGPTQFKNKNNKKNKKLNFSSEAPDQSQNKNVNGNQNNNQIKKKKKLVDGEPVRRKPIDDRSFQLIINGKEVELVRFDGFPIMKRDAERLQELKNNMIKKGIPKSEVNRTLKLERRRAEKALARLKRDVCYNCRKGGHNLSDCPDLKSKIPGVGAADGVCFKCGSTEHKQFDCKVQKNTDFKFATCFICKEPGHIARQCPDNPKGLYPNGGGCKLCGDVTHLRKDCPTATEKKEGTSIKLQTLDSTEHLEGIEQNMNKSTQETSKKPKKIRF